MSFGHDIGVDARRGPEGDRVSTAEGLSGEWVTVLPLAFAAARVAHAV
jgi:hypothetical protein